MTANVFYDMAQNPNSTELKYIFFKNNMIALMFL